MIQKFLILSESPEIRSDPLQKDKSIAEIELQLPIDAHDELQALIQEIRYLNSEGKSAEKIWNKFYRMIMPYVAAEKDRILVSKNIVSK